MFVRLPDAGEWPSSSGRGAIGGLIDGTAPGGHGEFCLEVLRGIVPDAELIALDVFGPNDLAEPGAVARALLSLQARGAHVIAVPLGDHHCYAEVTSAIEYCISRGVAIYAAAGNCHPRPVLFPACLPGVVSVAGADERGELLPECCREPSFDVLAPGLSAAGARGSSIACVIAAGVALRAISAGVQNVITKRSA